MAGVPFNFPDSPAQDEEVTAFGGIVYIWDGVKWVSGAAPMVYLPLAGGTMVGPLLLTRDPVLPMEAATMQWTQNYVSANAVKPAGANTQIQWNNNGAFGASPDFVFTSAGRVGIGTGTPLTMLHVAGTVRTVGDVEVDNTLAINTYWDGSDNRYSVNRTAFAVVPGVGSTVIYNAVTGTAGAIAGYDTKIRFNDNLSVSFPRWVGMGTDDPQCALDVAGAIRARNDVEIGTNLTMNSYWDGADNRYRQNRSALLLITYGGGNGSAILAAPTGTPGAVVPYDTRISFNENTTISFPTWVGMGTNNPQCALEVVGAIRAHNDVEIGVNLTMNSYWDGANNRYREARSALLMITYGGGGGSAILAAGTGAPGSVVPYDTRIRFNENLTVSFPTFVGMATDSPQVPLEVSGAVRIIGAPVWATSGVGLELGYGAGIAYCQAFDRSANDFRELRLEGNPIRLNGASFLNVLAGGRLFVGMNATPGEVGDIGVARDNNPAAGAIFLGNQSRYLFYDGGANYIMPNADLSVNGVHVPSDVRLKDNIRPVCEDPLALLSCLNFVEFENNGLGGTVKGRKGIGLVAQEVAEILPDAVGVMHLADAPDDDILTINYQSLYIHALRAIVQLKNRIEQLEKANNDTDSRS